MTRLDAQPHRFSFRDDTKVPTNSKHLRESSTPDEDAFSETAVSTSSSVMSSSLSQSHSAASNSYNNISSSQIPAYYVPCWTEFIDNSQRKYTSFKLKCGVTVQVGENVMETCPNVLHDLNYDFMGCLSALPASVRTLVRRTQIWVNRSYSYGPISNPKVVKHTTAHHFVGWLLCVRDNPAKEQSIEIYDVTEYQKTRLHYNGGGLMLHELCHLIHQMALPGGLSNPMVSEIYEVAQRSDKYTNVLRRDWVLLEVDSDMAYCMVNHKEFFAEISVAFLADFYHEVDGGGSEDMARCSPPFVSPIAIERIRCALNEMQKDDNWSTGAPNTNPGKTFSGRSSMYKYRILAKTDSVIPHCNKFFPFTKGQLRLYDPRVFKCFEKLWQDIESWEDNDRKRCGSCVWF